MAYHQQTEDRRAYDETARRDARVHVDASDRSAGSIVVIVVVALIGLGLLYWAATVMWAPTTTDITVTPAPTEMTPAPAPDGTIAPTDQLAPPPPAETLPAEPAPPAIEPAPPAIEPAPAPAPVP